MPFFAFFVLLLSSTQASTPSATTGGSGGTVVLEEIRRNDKGPEEQWLFRFKRPKGDQAPLFQLRNEPEDSFDGDDGEKVVRDPARAVLLFRDVRRAVPTTAVVAKLARQSRFVAAATVYPPLEETDRAIELVLKRPLRVTAEAVPGESAVIVRLAPLAKEKKGKATGD